MTRALLLLLFGCSQSTPATMMVPADSGLDPLNLPPQCTSGMTRDPNEAVAPEMMPGHACNECHAEVNASTNEAAPIFRFAGTVYPSGHEPNDCIGPYGATIVVTDSAGRVFSARSNSSGNFMYEMDHRTFSPPIRAKVLYQYRSREMQTSQMSGDCNTCHTASGDAGAPGRIVLP